jgi:hypothetical protein
MILSMAFPANNNSSEVMNPGEESLHLPALLVPAPRSAILSLIPLPARPVRRDHLDAFCSEFLVQLLRIIGTVSDEPYRLILRKPAEESVLDKGDFMRR